MVRTKTRASDIEGIGLFADQAIPKGTVVWKYKPGFDLLMTEEEVAQLSEPAREQFHNYAFLDEKYEQYMLCGDDGRFFNHSVNPNCDDSVEDVTTAMRDIEPGEELTVDYRTFYADIQDHPEVAEVR
jgi:hypothetical protein